MASLGFAVNAALGGSSLSFLPTRKQPLSGAQEIRFSLPDHSIRSVASRRARRRLISATAGQCAERNAETAANNIIQEADSRTFSDSEIRRAFPAAREGNGIAIGEHFLDFLGRSRLSDLQAREALAAGGNDTEADVERVVESLLLEEGQSKEDYRRRAVMFGKIAEFFSHGKADDDARHEESRMGASEIARTMQVVVDVVLAEDGRSAADYKCRAQLFAKSAEVFPFTADGRQS